MHTNLSSGLLFVYSSSSERMYSFQAFSSSLPMRTGSSVYQTAELCVPAALKQSTCHLRSSFRSKFAVSTVKFLTYSHVRFFSVSTTCLWDPTLHVNNL